MRISDWSSDVCSSDLLHPREMQAKAGVDARSERRVAVELPFDRYRLRVLGEIFVPADERQRREDRVAREKPHPFELGILHDIARGRDEGIDRKSTRLKSSP